MNILINTYCNLHCSYCFADPTMKQCLKKDMSVEDFKYVLRFLRTNRDTQVRIIGGEPTISPNFKTFINMIINEGCFQEILIFSNFTFNEDIANFLKQKEKQIRIIFLANINEFDLVLPHQRERIEANLEKFFGDHPCGSIGINIYKPDMDFTQWKNILEKYKQNMEYIRFSIAIPTKAVVENNFDFYEYYSSYEDALWRLLKISEETGVKINCDCASIPYCCFSDKLITELAKNNLKAFSSYVSGSCDEPVIDCKPDLTLAGCFGFDVQDREEKTLRDFKYFYELIGWLMTFWENKDWVARKECLTCSRYKINGLSCACKKTHLINKNTLEKKIFEIKKEN